MDVVAYFQGWLVGTVDFISSFQADPWVDPKEKLELNSLMQVVENRVEGIDLPEWLRREGKEVLSGLVRLKNEEKQVIAAQLKIRLPKDITPMKLGGFLAKEMIKKGKDAEKKAEILTRGFYMDHRREYLLLLYRKKAVEEWIIKLLRK